MSRSEIEQYCDLNAVPVCHDHTNDETIYTRNKIRHELLPYIESQFNGQIVDGLYRLGNMLGHDVSYIESSLDEKLVQDGVELSSLTKLEVSWFNKIHTALKPRLIRRIIQLRGDGLKDITHAQIDELLKIISLNKHGKKESDFRY